MFIVWGRCSGGFQQVLTLFDKVLGRVWSGFGKVFEGSTQRKSTREGFWRLLTTFGGYFWKSFPCKIPRENEEQPRRNQEKPKKN